VIPISVTWPDLADKGARAAISQLRAVYARLIEQTNEIKDKWRRDTTLLLEPIPRVNLGDFADDAPVITARALSLACSRSPSAPQVKLCVFDSIPTVAAYARAFRTCARSIHAETESNWIGTKLLKDGVREFMASRRSTKHSERSERVALVIACGEQPGGALTDGWSVDAEKKATTQDEIAVSEWLKRESNDRDERNRVFRATIAAASEVVSVDCDSITLVFTRFVPGKTPVLSAFHCIYVARQAIPRAGGQHSAMYVSVDSFVERVNESDRSNFESAIAEYVSKAL
jgi:hypothetical protein